MEIWWGFQIRYCTFPKLLSGPQNYIFFVYGPIWIIFFFSDLEIRWRFQIRYFTFPQMTHLPQRSNFLNFVDSGPIWKFFFLWLGNSMEIPNPILYRVFIAMLTKVKFLFYGPIWQFFLFFFGNSMEIPNPILYFNSNDSLDHKSL